MSDADSVDDIQRGSGVAQVAFQFLGRKAAQSLSLTLGQTLGKALLAQLPDGKQVSKFAPDEDQLHDRRTIDDRGLLHESEFLFGHRQPPLVKNVARDLDRARDFIHVPRIDDAKAAVAEMPQAGHAVFGFEYVEKFEIHDAGSDVP